MLLSKLKNYSQKFEIKKLINSFAVLLNNIKKLFFMIFIINISNFYKYCFLYIHQTNTLIFNRQVIF